MPEHIEPMKAKLGALPDAYEDFDVRISAVERLRASTLDDAKSAAQDFIGKAESNNSIEAAVLQGIDGHYYLGRSDLTESYYRPPGRNPGHSIA